MVAGGISYHSLCIMDPSGCNSRDSPVSGAILSSPAWGIGAPLFCMSFCLIFLLSANPPLAKDWCAWVMYGSDCQELLKPIQFQDSGSHFLSFMAHLMNSHYQLTCFIIVKALIEMVFLKKKKWNRKKKSAFTALFFSVPKTAWLEVHSPII